MADSHHLSWYKLNTSKMNDGSGGKIAQMIVGSTPSSGSGMYKNGIPFACYVTTAGSVYCGGDNYYTMWTSALAPNYLGSTNMDKLFTQVSTGVMADSHYLSWYKLKLDKFGSSSSSAGRTITITGSKLSKVTGVYIDSNKNGQLDVGTDTQCANLSIKSDSELTCTAPQLSPGTYNLFVVNASNQTMVPNALTYR